MPCHLVSAPDSLHGSCDVFCSVCFPQPCQQSTLAKCSSFCSLSFVYLYILAGPCLHRCAGFALLSGQVGATLVAVLGLLWWPLTSWGTGSGCVGFSSMARELSTVMHGLSSSKACRILPNQRWNPCLLYWPGGPIYH